MIIDFHTHCFPDTLAPRAMQKLSDTVSSLHISPTTDGTASGLLTCMSRAGIQASVVCNIATSAHQMKKVNDFAMYLKYTYPEKLIPLGSLHPLAEGLDSELTRLISAGITGIKIHPDYVGIDIDDTAFDPIFSLCETHHVFVITHAGFDPLSPDHMHCTPQRVLRVLERHKDLTLIVAHAGGLDCEDETLELLCGQNVYLDTSLLTHRKDRMATLTKILETHASDRLLFATDTPWTDAEDELNLLLHLPISQSRKRMILSENAKSLLSQHGYHSEAFL